jgi:predicted amidohydrolase
VNRSVPVLVDFTELTDAGRLYNTAAVFHNGSVVGLYRKLHPAINRSVGPPRSNTLADWRFSRGDAN